MMKYTLNYAKLSWECAHPLLYYYICNMYVCIGLCLSYACDPSVCTRHILVLFPFRAIIQFVNDDMVYVHILSGHFFIVAICLYNVACFSLLFKEKFNAFFQYTNSVGCCAFFFDAMQVLKIVCKHYDFIIAQLPDC